MQRANPGETPVPARGRWRRRLLLAGLLLAGLVLFHVPLFRGLAWLLVVDEPLVRTDAVVVAGSSGPIQNVPFDEVAKLYHDGYAGEVLLIEDRSSRIVQAGILPTLETVLRRELAARGVPERALTVRAGEYRTAWQMARALRDWLEEHPGAEVTVLADQFGSRARAYVGRTVLGADLAGRVHWRAVPDPRHAVGDWWHSRHGTVALFGAHVALIHTYVVGEPSETAERWDPDRFERELPAP